VSRRALVVDGAGALELQERPGLEPGPGEVVVRPAFCGLCGTDLELLHGLVDPAFVRYPLTLGHEWSGTVAAVGPGVEGIAVGARCVCEGIVPCGRCAACWAGATNVCESYDELGFTREGGASDEVLASARAVHLLEPRVSLLDAALVEPSAVVLRGLEKARPRPGQRVLVVGDGTIALLSALLAGLWSPAELAVAGRRPEQAELAAAAGATSFTTDEPGGGYDLVVEAAGTVEAAATGVRAAARGGTVLLLGLPPTGTSLELPADLLVNNDLTLAASFGYTTAAWARVVELLNGGRYRPAAIVTHRFPLARYADAFAELAAPSGARGKVVLELDGSDGG
jgi:2-desacetyl-2-hydroxyethyl bacteriochlorophyllide A dehydrogenase